MSAYNIYQNIELKSLLKLKKGSLPVAKKQIQNRTSEFRKMEKVDYIRLSLQFELLRVTPGIPNGNNLYFPDKCGNILYYEE